MTTTLPHPHRHPSWSFPPSNEGYTARSHLFICLLFAICLHASFPLLCRDFPSTFLYFCCRHYFAGFFSLFSHEYFHIFMWPLFGFLRLRLLTPATPTLSWQLWAKLSAADCLPSSEVACVGPCYLIGFCDSEGEHQMAGCSAQWKKLV